MITPWAVTIILLLVAIYCLLSAIFPGLPMPFRWGAAVAPSPTFPLSRSSRLAMGIAVLVFSCSPIVLRYKPAMFGDVMVAYCIVLIILLVVGRRDWHRTK